MDPGVQDRVLDDLPDGVIVIGASGAIVAMNRAAERITGWARDDAHGLPYGDVLRLRDAAGFLVHEHADPFTRALRIETGSPEREYMLHRPDGGDRWIALRSRYRWGAEGLSEVVVTFRDVGRRHRTERSAYDLIATLAHDLRSPLTSVKGFTSTILHRWETLGDDAKLHMLRTINSDADRMNRLLKDLLDFSRLEAGRLELRRELVDVAGIATGVAERVSLDAEEHKIETDFPADFPPVLADPGKIEQVLVNLVENAVKHGDPGEIRLSGTADEGSIVVRISDAGPGIDQRHLPYVFTKFYRRGASERQSRPGLGLGLYICKGIVEAHGGDIRVERSDPAGTVFAFTLPRGDE